MAQAPIIAKVSALSGQAYARDSSGNMRRLKLGDVIREGESVVAGQGADVVLALADGREMNVRPGETAKIDTEVVSVVMPDASDSAVASNPQGFQKITQALQSGASLDDLLEDTAAGAGPQGGNEGHTFVEFMRIVESVDPQSYQFSTSRGRPLDSIENAPLILSTTETTVSVAKPTINIPDTNNPGSADGVKTVAETDGPVAGSLTITAPAGLGSLSIGGHSFTALQLADPAYLVAHPINTGKAILTLQSYDPVTGVVNYIYDPAVQAHNGSVLDNISVTVADVLGNSTPDNLGITITDSKPVAQNDSNTITEDASPNSVSGSVLTGAGADTVGADANASPVTPVSNLALTYGTLTLGADGHYTYTLNNASPAVNGLNAGQTLTDSYTYTLTDGDGSTATATLTITIHGTNDVPVLGSGTGISTGSVVEAGGVGNADVGTPST
ncbi:MAG: retention module-containing protein, partial [Betaproteobacteria bacterium]|nr:retention module-containing protein [Betaproteobacteria bacterium]